MSIYFDNAATTRPMDSVVDSMMIALRDNYGNPSSMHHLGVVAENEVKDSKEILARILKVDQKEIFFTSGGTESNNLALLGVAEAYHRSGKHIITTKIEHPSVMEPMRILEEKGFEVTYLSVDSNGQIDMDELRQSIRIDTILVSIMHINNVVGTVLPIERIAKIIKETNKNIVFHVDAIQSFGKLQIYPKKWGIDCLSFSGHKLHGPKGIGGIYVNSKIKIRPIIYGGHQQLDLRSGTENVSGIVGLGTAAKYMYDNIEEHTEHLRRLKTRLIDGLVNDIEGVYIHGDYTIDCAPHIVNLRFEHVLGEVLLHALEEKAIYISTGSACSSNKVQKGGTLHAMGNTNEESKCAVRFSFSIYNTEEEVDQCIEQLKLIIPMLRRFVRK